MSNILLNTLWGPGELRREFRTVKNAKGEQIECMVIRRPLQKDAEPAVVPLKDMHLFYPKTQEDWSLKFRAAFDGTPLTSFMACAQCAAKLLLSIKSLQIEVDFSQNGTLRRLCDYIQDGFDELMKVRTVTEEPKPVIGEYDLMIDGEKVKSGELTERV